MSTSIVSESRWPFYHLFANFILHYQNGSRDDNPLFRVGLVKDREHYVHVFDDYTLDCILDELDTVSDLFAYLEAKESLLLSGKNILASGEEAILGKYMSTVEDNHHCIVEKEKMNADVFLFKDDLWDGYFNSTERSVKKEADRRSYIWDQLLERTFQHMIHGTLREMSHSDYDSQSILFSRFAKLNRLERRTLSDALSESWAKAMSRGKIERNLAIVRRVLFPHHTDTMLSIMWMHYNPDICSMEEYQKARKNLLNAKLFSYAKENPSIRYHIGIAKTVEIDMDPSEDFAYLDAADLPEMGEEGEQYDAILEKLSSTREPMQRDSIDEFGIH